MIRSRQKTRLNKARFDTKSLGFNKPRFDALGNLQKIKVFPLSLKIVKKKLKKLLFRGKPKTFRGQ